MAYEIQLPSETDSVEGMPLPLPYDMLVMPSLPNVTFYEHIINYVTGGRIPGNLYTLFFFKQYLQNVLST